jgi:hypothetical protein
MNLSFVRSMAIGIAAAGAFTVSSGCASSPDAKETVDSMNTFGVEVARVKDSIDHTLKALEDVAGSGTGDIQGNFDAYTKSVAALDKQRNVVRKRAEEMQAMGDQFFEEWEPEDVSAERRAELKASYAKIEGDMTVAQERFTPFLNSLKDIESYLKLDLSPAGVKSMGELVKKAKDNGTEVKSRIDAVLGQVNSVRGMLSTE